MENTTKKFSLKLGKRLGILYDMSNEERSRLQATLLAMLVDLTNACESIGVEFVVMGGSALGTVRHGGFIPSCDGMPSDAKDAKRHLKHIFYMVKKGILVWNKTIFMA